MTCQEFHSHQSDYLDGVLDEAASARCRAHMACCVSCARRERVVQESLSLLSALPAVEPSENFQDRLEHRLLHLQDEMARHDRFAGSGALATLAIATAIAAVAWGPMVFDGVQSASTVVARQSDDVVRRGVEWYGGAPGTSGLEGAQSLSAAFPGPYSPLIVEAPVTRTSPRAARAVFAAYYSLVE